MTMFVQKGERNLSLKRIVTEADSPIPIQFTKGEMYGRNGVSDINTQGTLAVGASVALNLVATATNRVLVVSLKSTLTTVRNWVLRTTHAMAGTDPIYEWLGQSYGDAWILKMFITTGQSQITLTNHTTNEAGTVLQYDAYYGDDGIWLPERKFVA